MKTVKIILFITAILMLAFTMFGCSQQADDRRPESGIGEAPGRTEDTHPSSAPPVEQENTPTALSAFPTTEEILSCLDAEESRMYWTAAMPELSGTIDVLTVKRLSVETVASELSEILKGKYTVSVSEHAEDEEALEINITPLEADANVEAVLTAMTQLTGMDYAEGEPEESFAAQYVPVWNGYTVDAEGIAYGGERAGDVVVGSFVAIFDDGNIMICQPLLLVGTAKTLDASELVAPDMVEMICEANYESGMGGACVTIITNLSLGYYYSDTEEALLPAWQGKKTFYRSQTGHNETFLMDAETGEMLRG